MSKKTLPELELDKKLAELTALEAQLTKDELELRRLKAKLHAFEREYLQIVGMRYEKLDAIEAEIARIWAFLYPQEPKSLWRATQPQFKAQESQRTISQTITNSESVKDFKSAGSLKKIYREVAKRIHPDLATNEVERLRRQKLMVEANQAYENGDNVKLLEILRTWERSPESVKGEGVAVELMRVIRKTTQIRERLAAIQYEVKILKQLELYQLRQQVILAKREGRNLLAEIASQIERQIALASRCLENLQVQVGICA